MSVDYLEAVLDLELLELMETYSNSRSSHDCVIWSGDKDTLKYQGETLEPARLNFTMRTGQKPPKIASTPVCGNVNCILPEHQSWYTTTLSERVIEAVMRDHKNNVPQDTIAERYVLSIGTVNLIIADNTPRDVVAEIILEEKPHTRGKHKATMRRVFTEEDILEIYKHVVDGTMTRSQMAARWEVNPTTINNIVAGKTYKDYYHRLLELDPTREEKRSPRKLSEEMLLMIYKEHAVLGKTANKIAKEWGLAATVVYNIVKGVTYKQHYHKYKELTGVHDNVTKDFYDV